MSEEFRKHINGFKSFLNEGESNDLIPLSIINKFYDRIKDKLDRGYKTESKPIQDELNRILSINGDKLPLKIQNLLQEY